MAEEALGSLFAPLRFKSASLPSLIFCKHLNYTPLHTPCQDIFERDMALFPKEKETLLTQRFSELL